MAKVVFKNADVSKAFDCNAEADFDVKLPAAKYSGKLSGITVDVAKRLANSHWAVTEKEVAKEKTDKVKA